MADCSKGGKLQQHRESVHEYGCPQCGANTWGMPTDEGFLWATCEPCLDRLNRESAPQVAAASRSETAHMLR